MHRVLDNMWAKSEGEALQYMVKKEPAVESALLEPDAFLNPELRRYCFYQRATDSTRRK